MFTAPEKWRVELRAKTGHYRNSSFICTLIPRPRTNLYDKSFIQFATREWNPLLENMKVCTSLASFSYLLDQNKAEVPNYFYLGERKAQILHARLRLNCSSLNADLFNNHVSDNDMCSCGAHKTAEHYLLYCNNHLTVRGETIHKINVAYKVEILLKGCPLSSDDDNGEFFSKVHKFIIESKRF